MTTDLTIAARLSSRSPAETDQLIRCSLQSRGVRLTERIRSVGGFTDDAGRAAPVSYVSWIEVGEANADDLRRAAAHHATALAQAEVDQIEMWLAELAVITARRRDDESTEALRAQAFVTRLQDYPADVARSALLNHRWRFWPTWAELAEVCDTLARPRRDLQARLEAAAAAAARREADASALVAPGQHRETRDERRMSGERASAIVAELLTSTGIGGGGDLADRERQRAASISRAADRLDAGA